MNWFSSLVDTTGFPPRWQCGSGWTALLGWTHIVCDLLIWGAYMAIPCVLGFFVIRRKGDVLFPKIFWLFALFIFSCGTVHLVESVIFWQPVYRLSAATKVATAIASWATIAALIPVTPRALALPGLERINAKLEAEIANRKRTEEHQRLLMHELDHRVKNNLASVLSIAEQTFDSAPSYEAFHESFVGRIQSLAHVHSALAREGWQGLSLAQLAHLVLDPYESSDRSRSAIEGPEVMLSAREANALCMVLHELATNALKYGSLSASGGKVHVQWATAEDRSVTMVWRERGGPVVQPPEREGYGVRLVEGLLAYELHGRAVLEFDPQGVVCTLSFCPQSLSEQAAAG